MRLSKLTVYLQYLAINEILSYFVSYSFVKQLLLRTPSIALDRKTVWRRTQENIAMYGNFTLTLTKSIQVATPSYVQILEQDRLSVTSFSLLRQGSIMQYDLNQVHLGTENILSSETTSHKDRPFYQNNNFLWPNELSLFTCPISKERIVLISDGFLMPGQNNGGVYAMKYDDIMKYSVQKSNRKQKSSDRNKNNFRSDLKAVIYETIHGSENEITRITAYKDGWFYHRALFVSVPIYGEKDGEKSIKGYYRGILTARAKKSLFSEGEGELVWLHLPQGGIQNSIIDFSSQENILSETVLATGPDVMFEVVDLNKNDDTIEIISAHFFNKQLSIHAIGVVSDQYPFIGVKKKHSINTIGRPYGLALATFYTNPKRQTQKTNSITDKANNLDIEISNHAECDTSTPTHILVTTHECSYDINSALTMAQNTFNNQYPQVKTNIQPDAVKSSKVEYGRAITSSVQSPLNHNELHNSPEDPDSPDTMSGGSLFAYELPTFSDEADKDTETSHQGSWDISNWRRSTLFRGFKVRGWGGIFSPGAPGFPYLFRMPNKPMSPPLILLAGDCTGSAYIFAPCNQSSAQRQQHQHRTHLPRYELAFEIECGATVGSAAVNSCNDNTGDVNLYIPAYELNKVHIFRLSDGRS